ncbi:MAG: tetratricopeptide repeat protein [Halofilum sp. (in: g-proteobacteria)]|nr:tetratricopeptide repeat protein [Halofilum sp. (in: g-proteobacteria)]
MESTVIPMAVNRTSRCPTLALLLALASALGLAAGPDGSPPKRAEALWREAAGLHVEQQYEAAIERFRASIALHPSARAHTWLAWSLSHLGDYERAVEHCRRAIALDPGYPNAYNDLGSYLVTLDRAREAEPWLRRALEFDDYCCPHYAWYHLGRAQLLQGRPEQAMGSVERSLQHRPNYRPAVQLLILLRLLDLRPA